MSFHTLYLSTGEKLSLFFHCERCLGSYTIHIQLVRSYSSSPVHHVSTTLLSTNSYPRSSGPTSASYPHALSQSNTEGLLIGPYHIETLSTPHCPVPRMTRHFLSNSNHGITQFKTPNTGLNCISHRGI